VSKLCICEITFLLDQRLIYRCLILRPSTYEQYVELKPTKSKGKGKGHPITGHPGSRGEVEVYLYSFSTSALGGGGWSAPRPGRFTPGKDPVPIVQGAGWAPGPAWTCAKNLGPTGIFF
jgi:hypothetical protein